jgi:Endonuclease/Exonuclease/phosphatase family
MNMDSTVPISLDDMASLPKFNFLNTLLNEDTDNFDFSDSPYDENTFNCSYTDEYNFHATFSNCKNLSLMSINIQSLNSKYQDLCLMINLMNLNNCSPDIICVQELWYIPDNVNYVLPGYHPLVCTLRSSAQGGGVGIFVKLCFKFSLLHSKSIFIERIFETIVIELDISNNSKIIIGSLYRPGTQHPRLNSSQTFEQFMELFSQQLNDLVSTNKTIYLLGDLNLDVLNYNKCAQVTSYVDLLFSFGLLQTVTKPTRYSGKTATIIDHVITNFQSNAYDTVILTSQLSDHFPIVHFKKGPVKPNVPNFTEFRNFSKNNLDAFRIMLHGTSWDHVLECDDAQTSFNLFHDTFFNLYELFFPLKRVKFNRNKLNWSLGLLMAFSFLVKLKLNCISLVCPALLPIIF